MSTNDNANDCFTVRMNGKDNNGQEHESCLSHYSMCVYVHFIHLLLISVVYNLTTDLMCKHNFWSTRKPLPSHLSKGTRERANPYILVKWEKMCVCVFVQFQPLQRLTFKIFNTRIQIHTHTHTFIHTYMYVFIR